MISTALIITLTFLATTAGYAWLLWRACRRVALHVQGDAEKTKAVVDNVLIPLLGRKLTRTALEARQ